MSRKKKLALALGLLMVAGCATHPPVAPRDRNILTAEGCAETQKTAVAEALDMLAETLSVNVKATSIYDDRASQTGNTLVKHVSIDNRIRLGTNATLYGVRQLVLSSDPTGLHPRVCVRVLLDRQLARRRLEVDRSTATANAKAILDQLGQRPAVLLGRQLREMHKLRALDRRIRADADDISGLGFFAVEGWSGQARLAAEVERIRQTMTLGVAPEQGAEIGTDLTMQFEKAGFRLESLSRNPSFVLQGGVRMRRSLPPDNSPWFWESYAVSLALVETDDMSTIFLLSTSGMTPGYTPEQAKALAVVAIEKILRRHILTLTHS